MSSLSARPIRHRTAVAGSLALASALTLTACGGGSSSTGTTGTTPAPSANKEAALAAKVPANVKADGKIVVGTDSSYAPAEFLDTDGKTVIGFDVDLFKAVAQKLGLQAQFVSAPFGNIIPGVSSGKYEVGVSSFTINAERKKQSNMVSYFDVGTQWATKKGNPKGVSLDSPCGKKVAVQKDTVQVPDVQARSKKCTAAGKPAVQIDIYQNQDQATASVISGKDDAMLADYPVAVYAGTQTKGQLALLGKQYEAAPYGYVVLKSATGFAQALQGAVQALIKDGTYSKILEKWKVQDGAVSSSHINP